MPCASPSVPDQVRTSHYRCPPAHAGADSLTALQGCVITALQGCVKPAPFSPPRTFFSSPLLFPLPLRLRLTQMFLAGQWQWHCCSCNSLVRLVGIKFSFLIGSIVGSVVG